MATDPYEIEGDAARIAFWINLYNATVIKEFSERPRVGSLLRHRGLFRKVGCEVGGDFFSLDVIEHGVLRLNSKPPYSLRRTLRSGDRRLDAAPSKLDPRIHFALNCAAASCPPVRTYAPDKLEEQLDAATRAYLGAETRFDASSGKLTLPYLMKLYATDFGGKQVHAEYVARYLPEVARSFESEGSIGGRVEYGRYDWTIAK